MTGPTPAPATGCLAMFAATAFAAALVTIGMSGTVPLYIPVFVVTAAIVGMIGAPLYGLAQRFAVANGWTAIAGGFVTGAAFPTLSVLGHHSPQWWVTATAYGMAGAASGLSFYLIATAPSAPRRNTAAIVALVAVSVAAALLVRPYFM